MTGLHSQPSKMEGIIEAQDLRQGLLQTPAGKQQLEHEPLPAHSCVTPSNPKRKLWKRREAVELAIVLPRSKIQDQWGWRAHWGCVDAGLQTVKSD